MMMMRRRMIRMTRTQDKKAGRGRVTRTGTIRDSGQQGGMSTRATRMKTKTTRMRTTRMRMRGEDNKEDKDEEK